MLKLKSHGNFVFDIEMEKSGVLRIEMQELCRGKTSTFRVQTIDQARTRIIEEIKLLVPEIFIYD